MLEELGRIIQNLVQHEIDIITESQWFSDLVNEKVQAVMTELHGIEQGGT
tara:strand:+ start:2536 stop:2685 length:150 start_codon:yes stop_codon:yes gene_type:complete